MANQSNLVITRKKTKAWYSLLSLSIIAGLGVAFLTGFWLGQHEQSGVFVDVPEKAKVHLRLGKGKQDKVGSHAKEEVLTTIKTLQDEIFQQKKELAFYQGIMAPEQKLKGLQISNFNVQKPANSKRFKFRLTLIQAKSQKERISGKAKILIVGEIKGKPMMIDIPSDEKEALKFRFRYFQHLEGDFALPNGFKPKKVQVIAVNKGKKQIVREKEFRWEEVIRVVQV